MEGNVMLQAEEISAEKIKSGIGGYKKKETKEYLDSIRQEYVELYQENQELKDKISILSEGVQYYKNMEKSLQKALVLAERTTTETVHAAEMKAQAIEQEANAKAELVTKQAQANASAKEREAAAKAASILQEAQHQADLAIAKGNEDLRAVHSQIMTLIQQYEQYKNQYKQLALAQMQVLESEAYNLDAPILQTIQQISKDIESGPSKEETVEKVASDVMEAIPVPDEKEKAGNKVFVDGRGQVYEAHEFREVTTNQQEDDLYFPKDETITEDEDWGATPTEKISFDVAEENHDGFFKPFESGNNANVQEDIKEEIPEQVNDPFAFYGTEEKNEQDEGLSQSLLNLETDFDGRSKEETQMEFVPVEDEQLDPEELHLKEVEKLQLQHIQELEDAQLKQMQFHNHSADLTDNTKNTSNDTLLFDEAMFMDSSSEGSYDFLKKDSEEGLTLQDLKRVDEEMNSAVPLPKASEESNYFSTEEMNSNIQTNTSDAEIDYMEQDNHVVNEKINENTNDISFDSQQETTKVAEKQAKSGFKSFRDFESEL